MQRIWKPMLVGFETCGVGLLYTEQCGKRGCEIVLIRRTRCVSGVRRSCSKKQASLAKDTVSQVLRSTVRGADLDHNFLRPSPLCPEPDVDNFPARCTGQDPSQSSPKTARCPTEDGAKHQGGWVAPAPKAQP